MNLQTSNTLSGTVSLGLAKSAPARTPSRELDSHALLAGNAIVAIRHGKDVYWLRSTRQGKLLLTK